VNPAIAFGKGALVYDVEGKKYIDFCSQTLNANLGQCHDSVNSAVIEQIKYLTCTSSRFSSQIAIELHQKLIDMIKNGIGKPVTFNEIRQFVADQKIKVYDDYFSILYQKVDEYANGKQAIATIIIAEYMYQCSLLIPPLKEIALMACISKLLTDLRK
jgi:hypothetical protein